MVSAAGNLKEAKRCRPLNMGIQHITIIEPTAGGFWRRPDRICRSSNGYSDDEAKIAIHLISCLNINLVKLHC